MTNLKQHYVGHTRSATDKRSLAMVLPSELVKSLNIDPLTILFLLKVEGHDELQLRIIRQEHLEKKDMENTVPADNVLPLPSRHHLSLNRRSTTIEKL